jgi:hypothetical protein
LPNPDPGRTAPESSYPHWRRHSLARPFQSIASRGFHASCLAVAGGKWAEPAPGLARVGLLVGGLDAGVARI